MNKQFLKAVSPPPTPLFGVNKQSVLWIGIGKRGHKLTGCTTDVVRMQNNSIKWPRYCHFPSFFLCFALMVVETKLGEDWGIFSVCWEIELKVKFKSKMGTNSLSSCLSLYAIICRAQIPTLSVMTEVYFIFNVQKVAFLLHISIVCKCPVCPSPAILKHCPNTFVLTNARSDTVYHLHKHSSTVRLVVSLVNQAWFYNSGCVVWWVYRGNCS